MKIYLDYAATTPIDSKVLKEMTPYFKKKFGNASSLHSFGQESFEAMEKARKQVADFLNCLPEEVFFTGSATEADNMAILGVVKSAQENGVKPHIVTTSIEHPAVLKACQWLKEEGMEISFLPVNKEGIIKISDIEKSIKTNTVLVSVMYANNEIGVIQPIVEIGLLMEKINNFRTDSSKSRVIFHTDAVQAINYLDCDIKRLNVDLLTLSAHKIYGPKGVGALFIRKGVKVGPLIYGGGQEQRKRPGTENVSGIVGLGSAIAEIKNQKARNKIILKMREKLIDGILKKIPGVILNGSRENRLPNNANITFEGVEGESILMALDQEDIAVSTGSACASGSLEPSHVLMAIGHSAEKAHGSIRFTLGRYTTAEEVDRVLKTLPKVIKRLRELSPVK